MEVTINIEANQIGDTVVDLFKGLSTEKKEELALSIMKEWLQSPEFFETKNKEQLIIEEFKQGKREGYWNKKFDQDTPDITIMQDQNFKKALETYKTSKQIMVEDLKNEVVTYYKKQIAEEIKSNEMIEKIKNETFNEIAESFPSIIMQVLINVFANQLTTMNHMITETAFKAQHHHNTIQSILDRIRN